MSRTSLAVTALLSIAVTIAAAPLQLEPCQIEGLSGEVRCGSHEVFEDRKARSGRRIPLKIVVLGAEKRDASDPLFIFAGGPGQAATENVRFWARTFAGVRRTRDIVLVDQRGTGGSNGLDCDLYGNSAQAHLGDLFPAEAVARCAEEWKTRADLRFYTSEIAMADIDEVREAIGYPRINILGTSYGTRAAQVYMRQFPDRVRSVIMKGVTQIVTPLTLAMARDAQRSWDILADDCAADPACNAAFPKLKEDFKAVFERLDAGVETEVEVAKDKRERVKITRAAIGPTIRTLLQAVEGQAELPLLIHQAAEGDFAPLAKAALTIRRGFPKAVSLGVFLGIIAIEDVAITDPREVARASEGTFLRDDYFQQVRRAAAMLPQKEMPPGYRDPVRSEIATLLISGHLDPATPASAAEEVARHLPKSKHVVVRYGSHAYGGMAPCVDNIMAEFIARASVEGLDTSCAEQIRRPAFVTSAAEDASD